MQHRLLYRITSFIITVFACTVAFAQHPPIDTNYIRVFNKTNDIEIYPDIYSTHFNFTSSSGHQKSDYSLLANSNAHISTNIDYKWLFIKYSWAMPGTQLDKNEKLQYTSLNLNFGGNQMRFRPFYESYNDLLIPIKKQKGKDSFNVFKGIRFTSAGFDYYFFTNTKMFSFNAAKSFSLRQIKSAGSFFLMATPSWQKIHWENPSTALIKDSATFSLLSRSPEWVSIIARIGYTYNFAIDKGKWIIAPAFLTGAGLLREINTPDRNLKPITNVQAWLNAGYNGPDYYFYFRTSWNSLHTNLLIKNMTQVDLNFSLTAGIRFHSFHKKIAGLL